MKSVVKKFCLVGFIAALAVFLCIVIKNKSNVIETPEISETETAETTEKVEKHVSRPVKAGDTIVHGSYPQGKDGTVEPIEWYVLKVVDDKALVISKKALDCQPYNNKDKYVTWEKCSLRSWLNNEFYNSAFTNEEQSKIFDTSLSTRGFNVKKNKIINVETVDKVFLLDSSEATEYFGADDYLRICYICDNKYDQLNYYFKWHNDNYKSDYAYSDVCGWWLRDSCDPVAVSYGSVKARFVGTSGKVVLSGYSMTDTVRYSHGDGRPDDDLGYVGSIAVRPCVTLDVHSIKIDDIVLTAPRSGPDYVLINEEIIPDELLRKMLADRYDLDRDGYFSKTELEQVREMNLSYRKITNLTGIDCFYALEKLDLSENPLSGTVDLSGLSNLVELTMNNNTGRPVDLVFGYNLKLISIECRKSHISNIDIQHCFNLEILKCKENDLSHLYTPFNTNLKELDCTQNQLEEVDLSACTKLKKLQLSSNKIYGIKLKNNPELEEVNLSGNVIGDLDLSNCPKLKRLWLDHSNIRYLDITNSLELEDLDLDNNAYAFERMKWTKLDKLRFLSCKKQALTSIDTSVFPSLVSLDCSHNELKKLIITNSKMDTLDCSYNPLTELDFSKSEVLYVDCSYSNLTSLKSNTVCITLNCKGNKLVNFDLPKSPQLAAVDCSHNKIKTINLKDFPDLKKSGKEYNKRMKGFSRSPSNNYITYIFSSDKNRRTKITFDSIARFSFK